MIIVTLPAALLSPTAITHRSVREIDQSRGIFVFYGVFYFFSQTGNGVFFDRCRSTSVSAARTNRNGENRTAGSEHFRRAFSGKSNKTKNILHDGIDATKAQNASPTILMLRRPIITIHEFGQQRQFFENKKNYRKYIFRNSTTLIVPALSLVFVVFRIIIVTAPISEQFSRYYSGFY